MISSARALFAEYSGVFEWSDLEDHVDDLIRRFGNKALGDTVYRVGRDLARKLAPGDRLMGTLRLIQAHNEDSEPVCATIAAALVFDARDADGTQLPRDQEIVARAANEGPATVLTSVCGLDEKNDADVMSHVTDTYSALKMSLANDKK